ncbi:hypothetical protein TNCV_1098111 [Trichonephila clavipes]|nr:hypothetical protein TNCV_1098111 [Trichonephila clavipes]
MLDASSRAPSLPLCRKKDGWRRKSEVTKRRLSSARLRCRSKLGRLKLVFCYHELLPKRSVSLRELFPTVLRKHWGWMTKKSFTETILMEEGGGWIRPKSTNSDNAQCCKDYASRSPIRKELPTVIAKLLCLSKTICRSSKGLCAISGLWCSPVVNDLIAKYKTVSYG